MRVRVNKIQLDAVGYVLSSFDQHAGFLDLTLALAKIVIEGNELGSTIGCTDAFLNAKTTMLEAHSECIYEDPPLHYFAVAVLQGPQSGGEVPIYDAREAARIVLAEAPDIAGVQLTYTAGAYKGRMATHSVVSADPIYGNTVRIRMTPKYNKLFGLPSNWTESAFYATIDDVLSRSEITQVPLGAGSIIYINNRITLHAQRPYTGTVHYLRVRFDDPNNVLMHL